MSKIPEELAADYVHAWWGPLEDNMTLATRQAFIAGYQARDKEIAELKTNWTFCCEDKARLIKELGQAGAAAPQWISVKDRLPEEDQEVLIYDWPFRFTCLFWKSRESAFQWELSNGRNCNPTHWMPLPNPPKDDTL